MERGATTETTEVGGNSMMIRLSALTLMLMLLFGFLVGLTRFLGQPSSIPLIFQPSLNCDMNCWNGIHLGRTTMDEAEAILRSNRNTTWLGKPYGEELYWDSPAINGWMANLDGGEIAKGIYLTLSSKITLNLGDAVLMWDTPIAVKIQICNSERPPAMVYFREGIVAYFYLANQTRLSDSVPSTILPTTPIAAVEYDDPAHFELSETQQWSGFTLINPRDVLPGYCG